MPDISGNPEYDAATADWGGGWRIPTEEEFEELVSRCDWQRTSQGGRNGYKVTGHNGNSIFLPAAGWRDGTSLNYAGEYGGYWSTAPYGGSTHIAYNLHFYGGDHYVFWSRSYYGLSVRPILNKTDEELYERKAKL